MERRALLAAVVAIAFLAGYQVMILKLYPQPKPGTVRQPMSSDALEPAAEPLQTLRAPAAPATAPVLPEQRYPLASPHLTIDVSSAGTIARASFTEHLDPVTREPLRLTQPDDRSSQLGFLTELTVNGAAQPEPVYDVTVSGHAAQAVATLPAGVRITRHYALTDHLIEGVIQLTNTQQQPVDVRYAVVGSAPLQPLTTKGATAVQAAAFVGDKVKTIPMNKVLKQSMVLPGPHAVVGQTNQYFALVTAWDPPVQQLVITPYKTIGLQIISSSSVRLAPGETHTLRLQWYAGPKEYRRILAASSTMAGLFPQGLLSTLGGWMLVFLRQCYRLTHNYGLAIIVLTLVVGLALFPLTWLNIRMSRDSMGKLQLIQPKLERLKEQHKDNPQKLNREMMALYKGHNINPLSQLGGCLPLLLQFPVFIALYNTINNSLELRGAAFLWIRDLSAQDRAFVVAGFPVNVLPLLMMGAMFLQQKLSPMKPAPAAKGMPNMTVMMTAMFGIMFYSLPSALVLYWLTNTVLMTAAYLAMRVPKPAVA